MIRSQRPRSLDLLRRLIAFDTTSRESNLELIAFVQDYLSGHGVESLLVHDETGRKANLYATIGPADRGGICLSGHTDVVPVDGQDWRTDPFDLVERDGRLYGRGTSDMKAFLAVALAFVPDFAARRLETPVHLAFSYDEEVGCLGVRRLIDHLASQEVRPALCLVGEPTSMKVIRGHKGKKSFRCKVRGFEAHSSLAPQAVNAVEYAAELVTRVRDIGRRKRAEGPFDEDFDVPHTTAHTGVIHGGTALNIVPLDCSFLFEFRTIPGDDADALFEEVRRHAEEVLVPEMRAVEAEAGISFETISGFPGLDMPEGHPAVTLMKALAGQNASSKVAFGTEAGLFQQAEIPTVICGPGHVAQAHKPNEFVEVEQVLRSEAMMARVLDHVTAV